MASLTFLNRKGVEQLLNSRGVRAHLTVLAREVLREAQSSAPEVSGAYKEGLHIEQGKTDRVVVRVRGNTDHDWFVEAEHGTLARAMDAAGVPRSRTHKRRR